LIMSDEHESQEVKTVAAECLASFAFPHELSDGIRKEIFRSGSFHTLLLYATKGWLEVHNHIEKTNFTLETKLAEGGGGSVWRGTYQTKSIAVKQYRAEDLGYNQEDILAEVAISSMLTHDNLVKCYGACIDKAKDTYYLVMEFMEKGNLQQLLVENPTQQWPFEEIMHTAIEIVKPTMYLHGLDIIHRDLKSTNFLVGTNLEIKLSDFGVSRALTDGMAEERVGTPTYMAPEIFKRHFKYSLASDVYAYGLMFWEICNRQLPFEDVAQLKIPEHVMSGKRPPLTDRIPTEMKTIMIRCWDGEYTRRPTMAQVHEHLLHIMKKIQKT